MGRRGERGGAGAAGRQVEFVALPTGRLVVDEDVPDGTLAPLADALSLPAPYHAFGLRQGADVWSVAARRVQVWRCQSMSKATRSSSW